MTNRWTHSNKAIFNIGYHIIWCPKYRRKVLVDGVEKRIKQLLPEIATSIECTIKTMEIMPDHIHIFIKCSPIHSPHYIVQQLKGRSSRILRQEFPSLKSRLPTLWTRSYFAESVGHISEETVKNYIQNQKNK
jgi:REP-associated tyrosine transposase